jgi:hypothetical protein
MRATLGAMSPQLVHAEIHPLALSVGTQVCATVRIGVQTDVHRNARGPFEIHAHVGVGLSALPGVRQSAHACDGLVHTGCAQAACLVSAKSFQKEGVRRALPKK